MRGRTLTPALQLDERPTSLWLIDLAGGRNRLGGSALAQVYGELGEEPPDLDAAAAADAARRRARASCAPPGMLRAYHDRSDGGLFVTLLEMAFAGHCGLDIALPRGPRCSALAQLFAEEPGVVVQIMAGDEAAFLEILARHGLARSRALPRRTGAASCACRSASGEALLDEPWVDLRRAWSETSWRLRRLRDDPQCADEEFAAQRSGRRARSERRAELRSARRMSPRPTSARGARPAVAILREQGVNSQVETAAVFDAGGLQRARRAHDRRARRAAQPRRVPGTGRLRRLLLRRCAGSGRGLGEVDPVPRGGARGVPALLCARATLSRSASATAARCSPRCKQHHPGHRALAALRAEPQRAVRGALLAGRGAALALGAARGHGRLGAADRGVARRGARGVCEPLPRREACAASGLVGLRYVNGDRSVAASLSRPIRAARRSASRRCRTPTGA